MTKQLKPIIHARDHLPDGADPIRGLLATPSFPDRIAELALTRDLRGYWRLGEGASPFTEVSGHAYGPADAVTVDIGINMTNSITGALPAAVRRRRRPVQHRRRQRQRHRRQRLPRRRRPDRPGSARRFNFDAGDASNGMTASAWVKPTGSSIPERYIVGRWLDPGDGDCGWRLFLNDLSPAFQRRELGSVPDVQHHHRRRAAP